MPIQCRSLRTLRFLKPKSPHARLALTLLALLVAVSAAPVEASGPSRQPFLTAPAESFQTTTTTQYDVLDIDDATRSVRLRDRESDEELVLQIHEGVPLRASKKADFNGRKRLAFEDLAVGHRLLVTAVAQTGEIKKVRVRLS